MSDPVFRRVGSLALVIGDASSLGLLSFPNKPKLTRDVLRTTTGVMAAVDGPMFGFASSERQRDYARYTQGANRFKLFYPSRGIAIAGTTPNDGSTLSVVDGVAQWNAGATVPAGATFAAQLYPTLIANGTVTRGLSDADRNKRVAVGIMEDGHVFLAYHPSINMPDFADALKAAGAKCAGYTDGGGSAALFADVNLDGTAEFSGNLAGRRVISWITLERKSLLDDVASKVLTAVDGKGEVLGAVVLVVAGTVLAVASGAR